MTDVSSVYNENANLRKIQNNLLKWDAFDEPLAPLTKNQELLIAKLGQPDSLSEAAEITVEVTSKTKTSIVTSNKEFCELYAQISSTLIKTGDKHYEQFCDQLSIRNDDCLKILNQIEESEKEFGLLQTEYEFVANKTSSLHLQSENIIQEQNKLHEICENIQKQLHFYTQIENISQRLASPTLSVSSEIFLETLNTIDECLEFMRKHSTYKDSLAYEAKYRQCLTKAATLITTYISQILVTATEHIFSAMNSLQISPNSISTVKKDDISSEAIFALYYGKFQGSAPKIKKITEIIEERINRNQQYEQLHAHLITLYFAQRARIMSSAVESALKNLTNSYNGDHCVLMRSSCAFLVHVCQDEHRLYYQFFAVLNQQLTSYLEGLCIILYDILRPFVIHINHLETLAEMCSIIKDEMLEEHVNTNPDSLEAFGKILYQLLNDIQERLVFRTHIYLQRDIANYKPSPGDLAYPEQLEMMEKIAQSLRRPQFYRTDSRMSSISKASSIESEAHPIMDLEVKQGNSPADLHGMWYPTVRRTLVCLSRLYRCVDRSIFQGLSQEALSNCIQSVSHAAQEISSKKSLIDGELFEIKHLLILREQIAPFRVDFTIKETSLDFSKIKTAAFSLLLKRKQLFVMGSNNALLEFLLDGTPQVKEHLLDSKKDVDRQLKFVCETFIKDATYSLVAPVLMFIEKAKSPLPANTKLRSCQWASPQIISGHIQESQRNIKKKLPEIQRSMQLYLSNKDTEFILLRPIRNNIIEAFVKLGQVLITNSYTKDDMTIVNCPSADEISFLVSSVNILEN